MQGSRHSASSRDHQARGCGCAYGWVQTLNFVLTVPLVLAFGRGADAAVDQLRNTSSDATRRQDRAVVIMTQADMFDPSLLAAATTDPETMSGFREFIDTLVHETNNFHAPVYLINARQPRLRRGPAPLLEPVQRASSQP